MRPTPAAAGRGREVVLDLLRLLAAFQMVQGHTLDGVLAETLRVGGGHAAWLWARGLTSVAFLFAAGLSFHVATLRDLPGHLQNPGSVARRFRRATTLLLLGYLLHAPLPVLGTDATRTSALLAEAVVVDVLQCIGACLLALESLAVWLRSTRRVQLACGALALVLLAGSPFIVQLDARGALRPLLNYVSPTGGSPFPLFPWGAHVLLGVALGPWLLRPGARFLRFGAAGVSLITAGLLVAALGSALVGDHLQRLGWVLSVCGLLSVVEHVRSWPPWLSELAGETLFIYVLHVLLVYGRGWGLAARFPDGLALAPALGVTLLVLLLSFGLARPFRTFSDRLARRTATG